MSMVSDMWDESLSDGILKRSAGYSERMRAAGTPGECVAVFEDFLRQVVAPIRYRRDSDKQEDSVEELRERVRMLNAPAPPEQKAYRVPGLMGKAEDGQ